MKIRCPHCRNAIEYLPDQPGTDVTCPSCRTQIDLHTDETLMLVPSKGEIVAHFELVEKLGTGGFGSVHSAKDTRLDRMVAIKLPRYEGLSEKYLKGFFKEARAAAQVRHPNIVSVHEIGQDGPEGRVYIVSDLIDGVSLDERLKTVDWPAKKIAELTKTILDALHAAHEAGVVHRDMKPANVLLDQDDQPFITDFGLAKRDTTELTVTTRGEVLGTPAYMSPEQASGNAYKADARSDIYSVGVILYRMLSGRKPFEGRKSRLLIHQVINDQPAPPRKYRKDIPKDLQTICLKAMEKDPAKRYQTAAEMSADLQRYVEGKPIMARPTSAFERAYRWARRNEVVATLIGGVIVLSIALVASLLFQPTRADNPRPEVVLTQRVAITTNPEGAEIAIAPLSEDGLFPIKEKVRFPPETTPLVVELPPGDYLIVAKKGDDFHEVMRRVPDASAKPLGGGDERYAHEGYAHETWVIREDGVVALPQIHLTPGLWGHSSALVEGGTFTMGHSRETNTSKHTRTVADFYMATEETTRDQYFDGGKMRALPRTFGDDTGLPGSMPMTRVRWTMAVAYAERVGGRLPTEIEFEYAATNKGTTRFPWGNNEIEMTSWELGPVRCASYDKTPSPTPIYGLYSNAAEWTANCWYDYPGNEPAAVSAPLRTARRIVRGADANVIEERPAPDTFWKGARRQRTGFSADTPRRMVGFRVVRSAKPRFFELKEAQEQASE